MTQRMSSFSILETKRFALTTLTFNVPCISEYCIEIKIELSFYFHT